MTPEPIIFTSTSPTFVVNPETDLQVVMVNSNLPGGQGSYQINPWYCATVSVATRFLAYCKGKLGLTATIQYGYPLGAQFTGPFAQSGMVPYFVFAANSDGSAPGPEGNSVTQNVAGLLQQYQFTPYEADSLMKEWFTPTN